MYVLVTRYRPRLGCQSYTHSIYIPHDIYIYARSIRFKIPDFKIIDPLIPEVGVLHYINEAQ